MTTQLITYEQPINELVRTCLRLEQAYRHLDNLIHRGDVIDHHGAICAIVNILNILDRPDLRSKITKELHRYLVNFNRLKTADNVDHSKLNTLLDKINLSMEQLHINTGKFGGVVRDNELLSNIRHHLNTPGGTTSFDTPSYHHWLHIPKDQRIRHLLQWRQELSDIYDVVQLLLRLIRQSSSPRQLTSSGRFYQDTLDPLVPCQLVRIGIHEGLPLYPEVSIGRHRVSIRFIHPEFAPADIAPEKEIEFYLTCCTI